MNIDDEIDDDEAGNGHDHAAPVADPVLIALQLCTIANNKTLAAAVKKLDRLDRQYADTQDKLASLTAQAAELETALTQRAAELDARAATITKREDEHAAAIEEARDHLRAYYDRIADMDRRIRYRILSSANLLHGFNERLQDLPSWPAIKQMIPGLPPDPPAAPAPEVVTQEVREDWAGSVFAPSTLTRTVSQ
jgi:ABC-type transporter Mla subunit MlaD